MNRILKFRAWLKETKEMIQVYDISWNKDMINTEGIGRFFDEIEIMQYTGLKDKRGKEIYEGDIIINNGSVLSVIYFDEEDVGFKLKNKSMGKMHPSKDYFQRYVKVIGNIYEHKHLSEVAND